MSKIIYPKKNSREMPREYKSTFRSLIPEIKSLIKMNKKEGWKEDVLIHNIITVVVWRIMDRDKSKIQAIGRLKRALKYLM